MIISSVMSYSNTSIVIHPSLHSCMQINALFEIYVYMELHMKMRNIPVTQIMRVSVRRLRASYNLSKRLYDFELPAGRLPRYQCNYKYNQYHGL